MTSASASTADLPGTFRVDDVRVGHVEVRARAPLGHRSSLNVAPFMAPPRGTAPCPDVFNPGHSAKVPARSRMAPLHIHDQDGRPADSGRALRPVALRATGRSHCCSARPSSSRVAAPQPSERSDTCADWTPAVHEVHPPCLASQLPMRSVHMILLNGLQPRFKPRGWSIVRSIMTDLG